MAVHDRSDADELLALGLARGLTLITAAQAAGVSESTARRRNKSPKFRKKVQRIRSRIVDESVGLLAECAVAAVSELKKLLAHPMANIRLRACVAILGHLDGCERSRMEDERVELEEKYRELFKRIESMVGDGRTDGERPPFVPLRQELKRSEG